MLPRPPLAAALALALLTAPSKASPSPDASAAPAQQCVARLLQSRPDLGRDPQMRETIKQKCTQAASVWSAAYDARPSEQRAAADGSRMGTAAARVAAGLDQSPGDPGAVGGAHASARTPGRATNNAGLPGESTFRRNTKAPPEPTLSAPSDDLVPMWNRDTDVLSAASQWIHDYFMIKWAASNEETARVKAQRDAACAGDWRNGRCVALATAAGGSTVLTGLKNLPVIATDSTSPDRAQRFADTFVPCVNLRHTPDAYDTLRSKKATDWDKAGAAGGTALNFALCAAVGYSAFRTVAGGGIEAGGATRLAEDGLERTSAAEVADLTSVQGQDILKARVGANAPPVHQFVKDAPILAYRISPDIKSLDDLPEIIRGPLGKVDRTEYTPAYFEQNRGSVIALQMNGAEPDFYIIGKATYETKYVEVDVARVTAAKVKSLKEQLLSTRDPNLIGALKTTPVDMFRMSDISYPIDKEITIESPWGTQTKPAQQDAFLVWDSEKNQYYMVNSDAAGLPINYISAKK